MFYPKDLFEVLEFDKVINRALPFCKGEPGRSLLQKVEFENDHIQVQYSLKETAEYKLSIESGESFPSQIYDDISGFLKYLKITDYFLELEQIAAIKQVLELMRTLDNFSRSEKSARSYPILSKKIKEATYEAQYLIRINQVLDDQGNVKNNASEQLVKIRKSIAGKKTELERAFDSLVGTYRNKGYLTESLESYRNGRRVLSVPAEHKRQIPGIIHDESDTGKTVFIEPEPLILLNNDLFELEHEEIREIVKIIKALCNDLSSGHDSFHDYLNIISYMDFVGAKANLALAYHGEMPEILDRPHFEVLKGFHPLLYIKNKNAGKITVPFDLNLDNENRMMLISGPNAGGKSILMKATGLLQVMVQCGFLVPVFQESKFGIFNKIFADIGDKQSLEEDLSTYSSHLKSMKFFTDHVDEETLVLIDEFGTGTDPEVGGAIAESVLAYINKKRTWGVITTHYSILKLYAHNNKGVMNGSMLFDSNGLKPTYIFKAGSPGSSFAFELARNNGLPKAIIHHAEQKLGSKKYKVDKLLNDLQGNKNQLDKQLHELQSREKKLDRLISNYENQMNEFEIKRKKLRQEAKEIQLNAINHQADLLDNRIKELSKENNLEKIRELAIQKKEERERLIAQVETLNIETQRHDKKLLFKAEIEVGDFVRLKTSGTTGNVIEVIKENAKVSMGGLTVLVPVKQLQVEREPQDLRRVKGVYTDIVTSSSNAKDKIDIRGLRMDEAMTQIQDFFDLALIAGKINVEILHGKGNGTLKKVVRQKLKEYNVPMKISHPAPEAGGDGITLVQIE